MQDRQKSQQSKREQFLEKQKKDNKPKIVILVFITMILAIVGIIFFTGNNKTSNDGFFGEQVLEIRSYLGQRVEMKTIVPQVNQTQIVLELSEIDENNIVYFESENKNGQMVPMMAYVTPSGRVFAGSSMCEPCRGTKFSLAGETLVCNTCNTTYRIENHEFVSGSPVCGSYPPVNMNPVINESQIVININEVLNWEVRG